MSTEFIKNWMWGINAADVRANRSLGPLGGDLDADSILNLRILARAIDSGGLPHLLRALNDASDANAPINADALLAVVARLQGFDGTDYSRLRTVSAAVQALVADKTGVLVQAKAADWGIEQRPAALAQATVTRAAGGPGARHVCTGITASVFIPVGDAGVFTAPYQVVLRDGATGAGTVLWSSLAGQLSGASSRWTDHIQLSGLSIVGSANTAMTLEFTTAAAGGSTTTQMQVALQGYTTL